jgi:hypothetical protein
MEIMKTPSISLLIQMEEKRALPVVITRVSAERKLHGTNLIKPYMLKYGALTKKSQVTHKDLQNGQMNGLEAYGKERKDASNYLGVKR